MISVDIVDVIVESDTGRGLEPITLAQHSPASVLSSFRAGYRTLLAGFPTVKRPIVAQPAALAMGHPARVLRSWAQHLQPQQAAGNTSDGFAVQNRAAPVPGVGNPQNTAPLRFHPCTNNAPAALTVPQIAEYNSAGFLSGIPLLSSGETAELRGYFEAALASIGAQQAVPEGGEESPQRLEDGSIVHYAPQYTIASVHLSSARVWDLMRHPLLVALVTDILGPNVVGWGAHLFAKLPHDPMRVSFHQDAVYWPIHPSKGVEVWLALDDVDSGNSCMRFVSGSHQLGALSFETSTEEEKNVLNLTVRDAEQHGEVVDNALRAGEISLHDPMLLHGSEPNASTRRRMGLTLRYAPCSVSAELDGVDWHFKGTVVAGVDESKRWANAPRPASE